MRTAIDLTSHDFNVIVNHYPKAQKDENGNIIWVNEGASIAKCKEGIHDIDVYAHQGDRVVHLNLNPALVLKIAEQIKSIQAIESEQFIDG